MPDRVGTDARTRKRIAAFRAAYGADLFPSDVLAVALERCQVEADLIDRLGGLGEEPYARLFDEGHAVVWHDAARHIAARASSWEAALSS